GHVPFTRGEMDSFWDADMTNNMTADMAKSFKLRWACRAHVHHVPMDIRRWVAYIRGQRLVVFGSHEAGPHNKNHQHQEIVMVGSSSMVAPGSHREQEATHAGPCMFKLHMVQQMRTLNWRMAHIEKE
ncbi:hypothetical protein NDU88_002406, partial [Pleurodeles waltl]